MDDHVNDQLAHLLMGVLGPTGTVALLGFFTKRFFLDQIAARLVKLSWLVRRELRNRTWRVVAKSRIEAIEREVERQRSNMHDLRDVLTPLLMKQGIEMPRTRPHKGLANIPFPKEEDDDEQDEGDFEE